jgi:hypothetical protein
MFTIKNAEGPYHFKLIVKARPPKYQPKNAKHSFFKLDEKQVQKVRQTLLDEFKAFNLKEYLSKSSDGEFECFSIYFTIL